MSLGATSLRSLPYTVNPSSMNKVIFIVMGMMLYYVVGGDISSLLSLSLMADLTVLCFAFWYSGNTAFFKNKLKVCGNPVSRVF